MAPGYDEDAEILKSKKNRVLLILKDYEVPAYNVRTVLTERWYKQEMQIRKRSRYGDCDEDIAYPEQLEDTRIRSKNL